MDPKHWDDIYSKKNDTEVSWFQENPAQSLELILELPLEHADSLMDIGGGNSRLVDALLQRGFERITLLDISEVVLQKTRERLGPLAAKVQFITSDIIGFHPATTYKLWHDRAVFHFLTTPQDIETYRQLVADSVEKNGYFLISTFSKKGPDKCSGLPVTKYSIEELQSLFGGSFKFLKGFDDVHKTPWGSEQSFIYCLFQKL